MGGWMGGWMEGKAGLRIAYSNQKMCLYIFFIYRKQKKSGFDDVAHLNT
jgi:hypothetical protein